jgi:hypothetical protein
MDIRAAVSYRFVNGIVSREATSYGRLCNSFKFQRIDGTLHVL